MNEDYDTAEAVFDQSTNDDSMDKYCVAEPVQLNTNNSNSTCHTRGGTQLLVHETDDGYLKPDSYPSRKSSNRNTTGSDYLDLY